MSDEMIPIDPAIELQRLPLWKAVVEDMIAAGVKYGATYSTEFFEEKLKENRDNIRFGMAVHEIRKVLERFGFYLTSRGEKGKQYVILAAEANVDVMAGYSYRATEALRRGVILGNSTPLNVLKAEDRRRHESMLEKLELKAALMSRSEPIGRFISDKNPQLLKA